MVGGGGGGGGGATNGIGCEASVCEVEFWPAIWQKQWAGDQLDHRYDRYMQEVRALFALFLFIFGEYRAVL